ncbi:MAG: UDP-N-acetylmuramate:L-alanyl-gamma-D-glutamyl-meso-diaminopimelate ligase [Acidobacteria bacterium]|nr:UDP-N-acetylmuramate:L-alanyl-gamma-D-glutamyl-meso-diaminopimelate ligase [Acidobacteriota bacterium]
MPRTAHLIGICGTGMGSLAGLLKDAGLAVRGSDADVYPPISTMLEAMGIPILKGYRAENLDPAPDVIVVGNIVGRANPEVQALLARGLPHVSMPEALGEFVLEGRHSIVVAGTHGKTTTSALMSHVLLASGRDPSFLVGGVLIGSERSYRFGSGPHVVVEGDEYETAFFDKGPKFLHYRPRTAIVTSVEYDHAEMFASIEAVEEAFRKFIAIVPADGTLVACADDPRVVRLAEAARAPVVTYGLDAGSLRGREISAGPSGMTFEASSSGRPPMRFSTPMTGRHNLANALAVIAASRSLGLADAEIAAGLVTFRGVHRRQEIVGEAAGVTVLDDFAHHPTAVRETIRGVRSRFPGRDVWAIFEPRTNTTRRSVFQAEYATAFDAAHRTVIAAVDHPERAPEGERFDAEKLVADLRGRGLDALYIPTVDAIVAHVAEETRPGDVVLVMSNGAFGGVHRKVLDRLGGHAADSARSR